MHGEFRTADQLWAASSVGERVSMVETAAAMAHLLCKSLAMALTLMVVDVSGQNSDAVVFDDQSSSAIGEVDMRGGQFKYQSNT